LKGDPCQVRQEIGSGKVRKRAKREVGKTLGGLWPAGDSFANEPGPPELFL